MKRTIFSPDWFPVTVKKVSVTGNLTYAMDYNCEKNLFELTGANGKTDTYTFKQLGNLFAGGRYFYSGLGKDGFTRPVFTNKDEIISYAKQNPKEKMLVFSEKTYEVYSVTGTRYFVNGEPVQSIPEGLFILHPCSRFREFETEQTPIKKSFPIWTAVGAFTAGIAACAAVFCHTNRNN